MFSKVNGCNLRYLILDSVTLYACLYKLCHATRPFHVAPYNPVKIESKVKKSVSQGNWVIKRYRSLNMYNLQNRRFRFGGYFRRLDGPFVLRLIGSGTMAEQFRLLFAKVLNLYNGKQKLRQRECARAERIEWPLRNNQPIQLLIYGRLKFTV